MKKQHLIIFVCIMAISLMAGIYQYIQVFQTELVGAFDTDKKANGHSWSEMPCTVGLCVTADDKVGIGTESISATDKLGVLGNVEINGDLHVSGDICNGAGACLKVLDDFVGTQPLYGSIHTYKDCTDAGGEVVPGDTSMSMCRFGTESNPVDNCDDIDVSWDWYKGYSTVIEDCCTSSGTLSGVFTTCTQCSDSHAWGDDSSVPVKNVSAFWGQFPWNGNNCLGSVVSYGCSYPGWPCGTSSTACTATSARIQIGCY